MRKILSILLIQNALFARILLFARACPPTYYLDPPVCRACPACPLTPVIPCGPGTPGLCAAGLVVSLWINGTDIPNITLHWPNATVTGFSGADAVAPQELACVTGFYRSNLDGVCRPCQNCTHPLSVEAVPCSTGSNRVCVPQLLVEIVVNGSTGLNASLVPGTIVYQVPEISVLVQKRPCPPNQYRSDLDSLCVPCRTCPALELSPCTTTSDRVCSAGLQVDTWIQGVAFIPNLPALAALNLTYSTLILGATRLSVSLLPCPDNHYHQLSTCLPCTPCAQNQSELSPCTQTADRICNRTLVINLEILGANGIDLDLLDLGRLAQGLVYTAAQIKPSPTVVATPIPCPSGQYIDTVLLLCRPCSNCSAGQYQLQPCGPASDIICANCSTCASRDIVLHPCAGAHDITCASSVQVTVNVTGSIQLNATALDNLLFSALLALHGPTVDPTYLINLIQHGLYPVDPHFFAGYDITTVSLNCSDDEYFLIDECHPCSVCPSDSYEILPCTNYSDTVCETCLTCVSGEYEACPCNGDYTSSCPTQNRVCYAYAAYNLTLRIDLVSLYNASTLQLAYLPAFVASVYAQTLCEIVGLDILEQAARDSAEGYSIGPITGYEPEGFFVATVQLAIAGLFAQAPNPALDFTGVIESALYFADNSASTSRRLFQRRAGAGSYCAADTYAYNYPNLGLQCVPCQDNPVPTASTATPPALWWTLAPSPCNPNYARVCYGGTTPPICILRVSAGAALINSSVLNVTILTCPPGQEQVEDPATGIPFCYGIPCGPGYTGVPGYCQPCRPGLYKSTVGPDPCTACPTGTYAALPASNSSDACLTCPTGSTSIGGSSSCFCVAGYYAVSTNSTCQACGIGTYRPNTVLTSCIQCSRGSYASSTGSTYCVLCPQGFSQNSTGASFCALCAPGYYQSLSAAASCIACSTGTYAIARVFCAGCQPGLYQPAPAASSCLLCPAGAYSLPSASACVVCPGGTYLDASGCAICPVGTYGAGGICVACPTNFYQPVDGSSACQACAAGYAPDPARTTCQACTPGYAGFTCQSCLAGTYSTGSASTTCVACAAGTYSVALAASSILACQDCPSHFFAANNTCVACPPFTAAPPGESSSTNCLALPGYYAAPGGPGLPCPAGSFCIQGSMRPAPCPSGTVSAVGSSTCLILPSIAQGLQGYDWIVASTWFVVAFLGVGCVMRTQTRRRAR